MVIAIPASYCKRIKKVTEEWVWSDHGRGQNTHNVSATVYIPDDKWDDVGRWMWLNRHFYNGLSCFPYDENAYPQPPFEATDKKTYEKMMQSLNTIDLTQVTDDDNDDFGSVSSSASPSVLGGVKLPIAHGFFTVSLLTFLSSAPRKSATWCKYEINCGMKNVKFVKPVEVNSVLGCRTKVKSVSWKRGREMLETTYECEMFKEGGRRGNEKHG